MTNGKTGKGRPVHPDEVADSDMEFVRHWLEEYRSSPEWHILDWVPDNLYSLIVEHVPVLCVDILLQHNETAEYLLIKRANEPLKGEWWVIGGAVKRGETDLEKACLRIANAEIGVDIFNLHPIGYYSEFFHETPHGPKHTLSIVFSGELPAPAVEHIKLDDLHSEWKFARELPEKFRLNCKLSRRMCR
jgi:colanic acid biosynthesis protein WcaH